MARKISREGLAFIEKWEQFVPYVYDDKVPMRKIGGVRRYPEWDGTNVRGTLTIGYGHTDAAGYPKIHQGMRVTKEEAEEILDADLDDCEAAVNRVKLPLTQAQFDVLVSFTFNCGPGNLKKLVSGCTAKNYASVIPRKLMQYVNSKGERMQGLVNRRAGEVRMWGRPDDEDEFESMPIPSTAEREEPPKGMIDSKTAYAATTTGGAGAAVAISTLSDTAGTLAAAKSNVQDLGIMDYIGVAVHNPIFWLGVVVVACTVFIYWDRNRKLKEDHI